MPDQRKGAQGCKRIVQRGDVTVYTVTGPGLWRFAAAQSIYQHNSVLAGQGSNPGRPIARRPSKAGKKDERFPAGAGNLSIETGWRRVSYSFSRSA